MDYSDPKWHWNAPFATPEAEKSLGEDPRSQTLYRECYLCGSVYKHVHTPPSSALRAFRLFDPCLRVKFLCFSETLGDCSFLNTCYHMDTCKYVHYTIDFPEKKLFNMKSSLQTKSKVEDGSILFPPQV